MTEWHKFPGPNGPRTTKKPSTIRQWALRAILAADRILQRVN